MFVVSRSTYIIRVSPFIIRGTKLPFPYLRSSRKNYTQSSVPSSNSVAAQQRKKVLTFEQSSNDSSIHPLFATSSNLETFKGKQVKPVVSITKSETYDLQKIKETLTRISITPIPIVPGECIKFEWNKNQEVFVFKFGTIVAWDIDEKQVVNKIIPMFTDAEINSYPYQSEDLDYIELDQKASETSSNESFVSKETEIICLKDSNPQQKILDMLAFSYGISRSTRLAILEESVQRHIEMTRSSIDKLSQGKRISVNPKEALKVSGRILLLRGKLNLYSELVETPDIYWSESKLERIHENISTALDISKRVSILNRKLDYLSEESQAMISILSTRKEVNLELIIIYLIVIEVCYETYHFYERLGGRYNIEYFRDVLKSL